MTADDWQPLRELGLNEEGLLEEAPLISTFTDVPRMADGFGLKPERQVREAGETGVPLRWATPGG